MNDDTLNHNTGDSAPKPTGQAAGNEFAHANPTPYQILGQFLQEDDWYPQPLTDLEAYRMGFNGRNGELRCFAQVRPELSQFLFYAVMAVKAPPEKRPAVAEFITRANFGLRIGNFELDYSDGEVRYKASLDFEGEALSHQFIRNTIYPAVQTMDLYLPGLLKVIYGGLSPEAAIAEVEDAE
jgi:hypothetical protein